MFLKLNFFIFLLVILLASCNTLTSPNTNEQNLDTNLVPLAKSNTAIAGQYIVILKGDLNIDELDQKATGLARAAQVSKGVSLPIIKGFVVKGVNGAKLQKLKNDPRVDYIQPDRIVQLAPPTGKKPSKDNGGNQSAQVTPWGITRIGATGTTARGANVDVFVVDTGIDSNHSDLTVIDGYAPISCTSSTKGKNKVCRKPWDDDQGHGTHVAGTIAALDNDTGVVGVAPAANLHAVKVLNSNGSGSYSGIIQGINWITSYQSSFPKVINMSLGGSGTERGCGNGDAMQDAVCAAVNAGVTVVVAAGNSNNDAANYVPASYDQVITVSATGDRDGDGDGQDDFFTYFTNWGSDVDIAAPGFSVYSTLPGNSYAYYSGTSMASPHVAGAAALYLSSFPTAKPLDVQNTLMNATSSTDLFVNDSSGPHYEGMLNVSTF